MRILAEANVGDAICMRLESGGDAPRFDLQHLNDVGRRRNVGAGLIEAHRRDLKHTN